MNVSDIVTRVKAAIDELRGSEASFADSDEDNLGAIITQKISDAVQFVLEHAALEKLSDSDFDELSQSEMSQSFSIDSTTMVGSVKLPAGLLRIVEAKLSSWSQSPVPESDSSQVALMQQDTYARGSWDRPVTILSKGYLYLYCAKNTTDTLQLAFISKPSIEQDSIKIPTTLEAAVVYQVAGLTMMAYKDESAQNFFTLAAQYMGLKQNDSNT